MEQRWWLCPNEPPCPHGGALHDVEDFEDRLPRCCAEGCSCGSACDPVREIHKNPHIGCILR